MGSCCVRETKINVKFNKYQTIKIGKKANLMNTNNLSEIKKFLPRGSVFQINDEDINKVYEFQKKIGTGFYGKVRLANPKNNKNKLYAIKSIDRSKLTFKKIQYLSREIEVLASLDHPNVVKYYETYNDIQYFHIVTEYLCGGELFEIIKKRKRIPEPEAATIIYKLTSAIIHCQAKGIVHRDLKPENILFENQNLGSEIKIIDFGLSRKFLNDELNSIVGSPYYVSPEVLEGKYDYQCDIWGIGVIMYVLLCGKVPFFHENKTELYKKIKFDPLCFDSKLWEDISIDAIELLTAILNKDPKCRPKANKIMEYTWFSKFNLNVFSPRIIDSEIINFMKSYRQPKQLVKTILKIIAKEVKSSDIENLKKMFIFMDINKTGFIDLNMIQHNDNSFSNGTLITSSENIFKTDKEFVALENKIDYSCFISSCLMKKNLLRKDILEETFQHLDLDNTGYITVLNFQKALKRTGKSKMIKEIEIMFNESGFPSDSKIDFKEFCDFIDRCL